MIGMFAFRAPPNGLPMPVSSELMQHPGLDDRLTGVLRGRLMSLSQPLDRIGHRAGGRKERRTYGKLLIFG